MSSSDDDSQQRFSLGFLFALIALVISVVVGTVVVKRVGASGAAAQPVPAVAADAAAPRPQRWQMRPAYGWKTVW